MDGLASRPLRIAFLKRRYTPFGGAERYLSSVMQRLLAKGHEVHLFTNRWEPQAEPIATPHIHHVPVLPGPSHVQLLSFASHVRRVLKRGHFDIVHSFDRTYSQDIYRAGGGCHREWIYWRRRIRSSESGTTLAGSCLRPSDRALIHLERAAFTRTPLIIANSTHGKKEIVKHYKVDPERIRIIYNGVDLEAYHTRDRQERRRQARRAYGIADEEHVVLFVGSDFRRKGVEPLIRALIVLARHGWHGARFRLVVAGKGRPRRYKKIAAEGGILSRTLFLGPCRNVRHLYPAADVFTLPSCFEPFSNACMEAMASGLPVITSRVNGVAEILQGRPAGGIVRNPLDAEELARTLSPFGDRAACERAGAEARRIAEGHPLAGKIDAMLSLYEEYLERRRRDRGAAARGGPS